MSRIWKGIYAITCIVLISLGVLFIDIGLPNITNDKPNNGILNVKTIYFDQISTWFYIKAETLGAFIANNPINVTITTTSIDLSQIREIQLDFLGVSQYFPYNIPPPMPPSVDSSQQAYEQYQKAMDNWSNNLRTADEALRTGTLFLENDTSITSYPYNSLDNVTIPDFSTFSGSIQNLTYPIGGQFNIGITIHQTNGHVIGYGLSDTTYILNNAIDISPPETLYQIESNNILTGLGWIGVGLPFLLAGLTQFLEILKRYAFPPKQNSFFAD